MSHSRNYFLMAITALAATTLPSFARAADAEPADTIVTNGRIYTSNPAQPWVEAVAVRAGKIIKVGNAASMRELSGSKTEVVDLGGAMAMPGIVDAHVHVANAARQLATFNCLFSQYADLEAILGAVRECATKLPPGEWIIGHFWNSALHEKIQNLDALRRLDEASGGRPTVLSNDNTHDRWLNTAAMAAAGITAETVPPPSGVFVKDKAGKLTGVLIEARGRIDSRLPKRAQPPSTLEERMAELTTGIRALNAMGVTTFGDNAVLEEDVPVWSAVDRAGGLTARANLFIKLDPNVETDYASLYERMRAFESVRLNPKGAKIYLDGVFVSRTGVVLEPYLPDEKHGANFRGVPKVSQERLNKVVTELDRLGVPVRMHASADGAARLMINSVDAARKANGPRGPAHTLVHGGYVSDTDMARLKPLNIIVDASPTVWYPGPTLSGAEAVMGRERAHKYYPFKSMLERGISVAGGTDWKTLAEENSDLWSGIEGMVTRRNPSGKIPGALWPEQAIDLNSALMIYTISSAKSLGLADDVGSLEIGKSADLIVLNQNLFSVDPEKISETKIVKVLRNGQSIYDPSK